MTHTLHLYEILPNLYQSERLAVLPTVLERIRFLNENQIVGVVNLWHTPDYDVQAYLGYYKHFSIPDGKLSQVTADELWRIAAVVHHLIGCESRVLVHCYGGRNRSGLLNAMVVMLSHKCTGEEAVDWVRRHRPNSLFNPYYLEYLKSLEAIHE